MTGLMQGYVWLGLGVALGLCGGFPWGRWNGGKALDRTWDDGYDAACIDSKIDRMAEIEQPPGSHIGGLGEGRAELRVRQGGVPALPAPHEWQEQMAAELAPEALAAISPAQDTAWREMVALGQEIELDVPEPGHAAQGDPASGHSRTPVETAGFGHPSPYNGTLTPAQRRRDKHKQRGQYAPAPGWTADPEHVLASHWKPEGDRWMAEWRIEWQDDVAAVDEEIAAWTERQRAWLAADRWDRGARRLGAVA